MARAGFRVWVALAAVLALSAALVPADRVGHALTVALGLGSAAAMVAGLRINRPPRALPWLALAASVGLQALGDATYYWYTDVLEQAPYPSPADVLYLLSQLFRLVGFVLLVRIRSAGRDREGLIDSSIFTVSVSLVCWVFLFRPTVVDGSLPFEEQALQLTYPVVAALILGLLIRLLTTRGGRAPSFVMLLGAAGVLLGADIAYAALVLTDSYQDGNLVDSAYLLSYALWGAAALHPSMDRLSQPAPERLAVFTRTRLVALTVAGLAAPGVLAVQLSLHDQPDGWAVVVGSTLLFGLVILRMYGLLAKVRQQAGELEDLARTDALTGLPNRRSADAELERRSADALRHGEPLVVALLDLDRFKAFNDTYGHPAGDRLLVAAAHTWRSQLKSSPAVVCRYGGEEFLVVANGLSLDDAVALVDTLRIGTPLGQTFSAGAALWDGTETVADLVGRADAALYRAKAAGRNQVLAAVPAN